MEGAALKRLPILTAAAVALAVAVYLLPGLERVLIYDRDAIRAGEWWRIFTGHWAHFSGSHLLYDGAALLAAGLFIERESRAVFAWFCATLALGIGGALFLFAPAMNVYGGLSGIVMGALVFLALRGIHRGAGERWIGAILLVGIAAKIIFETTVGQTFARFAEPDILVSTASHVAGVVIGTMFFVGNATRRLIQSKQMIPEMIAKARR